MGAQAQRGRSGGAFGVHRPAEGTNLKNGEEGERPNALNADTAQVLRDYIAENRITQIDEFGRTPLFTTERGRMAKSTIQRTTYKLTQPCFSGDCPFEGYEPDSCRCREHGRESLCPGSLSPHRVRTGAISHMRESGLHVGTVSERVDATPETIKAHYDRSDGRKLMENRRDAIQGLAF